jgi:hypothetical protein
MRRNVIFVVLAFFIINASSAGAGMIGLATGSPNTGDYVVLSLTDKQTIGTGVFDPLIKIQIKGDKQDCNINHRYESGDMTQFDNYKNADNNHSFMLSDVMVANLSISSD